MFGSSIPGPASTASTRCCMLVAWGSADTRDGDTACSFVLAEPIEAILIGGRPNHSSQALSLMAQRYWPRDVTGERGCREAGFGKGARGVAVALLWKRPTSTQRKLQRDSSQIE